MTWVAADPILMGKADRQVKIQTVAVPVLPKELPEEVLATLDRLGAEDPSVRDALMVLATERGVSQLRRVHAMAATGALHLGGAMSVLGELMKERQIAVLRWAD